MAKKKKQRTLSDKQVEDLLLAVAERTATQAELALRFKLSRSTISDICTGRIYADVKRLEPTVKRRGGQFLTMEEQVAALEREVIHLRLERSHAKRLAKTALTSDGMVQHVIDIISDLVVPMRAPKTFRVPTSKGKVQEHAVLLLSDQHLDQIVVSESVGGHERFDFKVGTRRSEYLIDEVLKFLTKTMSGYSFSKLHVLCLGDSISSPIHNHTVRSAFRNDIINSHAAAQVLACMLSDLAPHFPEINVLGLSGNHPRKSTKKTYTEPLENLDYAIVKVASMLLREHKNISFYTPDSYSATLDINGLRLYAEHGDDLRGAHPILALKDLHQRMIQLDPTIDAYVCGHYHQEGSFQLPSANGRSVTAISNGALIGTDPYAFNVIKAAGTPSQTLFGVHANNGITWRLPFKLRTKDETKGPKRYRVEVAEHLFDSVPVPGTRRVK